MDVALSRNGAWAMRLFFALVVVFLYAPIVILLIFSFNNSEIPSFPLSGFTFHWYREFIGNSDLRGALWTSAKNTRIARAPFFESATSISPSPPDWAAGTARRRRSGS